MKAQLFIAAMFGALVVLYITHLVEQYIARRNERQLEDEMRMRRGVRLLPDAYKARLARFNEDCN